MIPHILAAGGDMSPGASLMSDALSDTGRIPGQDDDGVEGPLGEDDDVGIAVAGESTPFYLDDSPEATHSLMSDSPVDWRSARSAYTPRSSELAMHGEAVLPGALSEGVEAVGGVDPPWPHAVPGGRGETEEEWLDGSQGVHPLVPLAVGARSVYVDEAGTVHYANANGAFPTLPRVSESAQLGEVDDGGAFVDGGGAFGRMPEAGALAEGAVGDMGVATTGAGPVPGRIKSERSLNLMPPVPEESEGALEDSTRRLSSSDVRSSAEASRQFQQTGELSAEADADTVPLSESGGWSPEAGSARADRVATEAEIARLAGVGVASARARPRAVSERAGRGAGGPGVGCGGGRRGLGEGRGRLELGAQERAAEWLDSAALPSLCRRLESSGEDVAAAEATARAVAVDVFEAPRSVAASVGPMMGPLTRASGSGSGSGSAGQWETVRVADAMQGSPAAGPVHAGMLGALPLALMRERSVTDISLGNFSEPWASGYTPSYPPSSTEITPTATVIGSEHGGPDDAADTQELVTVSPVAAPMSQIVSTSNTAPNTMQLLTSYPYLAELSTTPGDQDGDTWLAHTGSSGAPAGESSRSDAAKVEAAAAQHARSQARSQTRRVPPRSGAAAAAAAATAAALVATRDAPPLDSSGSLDKIGRHLDGHDIQVESGMFSSSSTEGGSQGPALRHVWDQATSAPLQNAAAAEMQEGAHEPPQADAVSVPLPAGRPGRLQGRRDLRCAGLSPGSPKLPLRKKGRTPGRAAALAQLERMLEHRDTAPSTRATITRHAAAGAVVARAAYERARSASPLGAADRGRRAIVAASSASTDADIASARSMAREQAASARSTRGSGWSGRGRPVAVHSPSPDTAARHRPTQSTPPTISCHLTSHTRRLHLSPDRTPLLRSPSHDSVRPMRPDSTLPDSLHVWAARPRSGPANLTSSPSAEDTIATTSASSIPLFKSPPSPSSAPTPSMSAFTGHLPQQDPEGSVSGPAIPGPTASAMVDSSGPVTANPSLSFTDLPPPGLTAGDTGHASGHTVFYTAMEPSSRSGRMSERGSTRTSEAISEPRFEKRDESVSIGDATGSMPSSPESPAVTAVIPVGPDFAEQQPPTVTGAAAAAAAAPAACPSGQPQRADSGSPLTSSMSATGTAPHAPTTIAGDDSLFDLNNIRAMGDISLGGVSSTGPSDALHDSMTPTASVHGATLATWVHTSGRSSLSPPPSIQVPETSITLPAVPAAAATLLTSPREPAEPARLAIVQPAEAPFNSPNPTAPDPVPAEGDGDTPNALPLLPQHSVTTGSGGGSGGSCGVSDALNGSTPTSRGPGGNTASTTPGEAFDHTASTAPGSWTSAASGHVAEGPKGDRMASAGSTRGRTSLDLASTSVHSVSHDAADMGASSLVLTATRSSGITVFRSGAAPSTLGASLSMPRPATAPDGVSGAPAPSPGCAAGKPPLPDTFSAGGSGGLRGASSSSPLPPLGPSQAAAKRRGDAQAAVASPLSPASISGSTPTGASAASPMIAAARMDGDAELQRVSHDSSTQMVSRPLSGVSGATSEITRDISPSSSTPVVVEPMHESAVGLQLPPGWDAMQRDGAHQDSMLGETPEGEISPARERQQSVRSRGSASDSPERRALEASPDTSRGPATSTRESGTSNTDTPRPCGGAQTRPDGLVSTVVAVLSHAWCRRAVALYRVLHVLLALGQCGGPARSSSSVAGACQWGASAWCLIAVRGGLVRSAGPNLRTRQSSSSLNSSEVMHLPARMPSLTNTECAVPFVRPDEKNPSTREPRREWVRC